ncbi:LOW QUALITY PROTEIN: hypothetical protein PHMEG_00025581 [Phytophthora megakarya]|uniref:Helitron helicase n=1 Tax=Phytophthora megakarya TaxID=4795 RepID=A0A225VBP0_9STRA|nr:LOW QUALITY PROTEIN: hypothetical protein PHMEG_00025581 [Phytophthora megakarya]
MLSSRRFVEDAIFLLVAFDRLSTQKMFTQISLTCKRHPGIFDGYDRISSDDLDAALQQNELRLQGRVSSVAPLRSPLINSYGRSRTGALWGSISERESCRREVFGFQTRFGQPTLFVTLTPNVANSFAMA